MLKIMIVFGTRPEAIKLAPVIKELEKFLPQIDLKICVSGQHRQLLDQVLSLFEIVPHYNLDVMTEKQTLIETAFRILQNLEKIFRKEEPDIILIQGDTTTAFVSALTGFYSGIKIAHLEAGLRTCKKCLPFPEEMNRRLISLLADFHFAPTLKAKEILLTEKVPEKRIFITGNTVIDSLMMILKGGFCRQYDHPELRKIDFNKKILLVTAHRRESFGEPLERLCMALNEIARNNKNVEIVYPIHLNPFVRRQVNKILTNSERIHLISPLDYSSFIHLMNKSYLVLTDSGGIQEEAPALGKPTLVLRDTTERVEALDWGCSKLVGTEKRHIVEETQRLLEQHCEYENMARARSPYGDGRAAQRVVNFLCYHFRLTDQKPEEFNSSFKVFHTQTYLGSVKD